MRRKTALLNILVVVVPVALLVLQLRTFERGRALTRALSETETRAKAKEIGLRIRRHLLERANDLEVLAEIWRVHKADDDYAQFRNIASRFLAEEGSYHAINYVDPDSVVRATVPDSNRAALLGKNLKELPGRSQMHAQVRETNRPLASPPITLVGKYPGFVIWYPITGSEPGPFQGLIAAAVKTEVLMSTVLREMPESAFLYRVGLEGQTVFGTADPPAAGGVQEESFEALGRRWTVHAWPKPGTELARVEEPIRWHLLLGLALSLVTGALLLTVARANRRLAAAQVELHSSEENLRITLDSIGDAVIATDIAGRVQKMNPVAEKLTGWPFGEARGRPLPEVFQVVDAQTRQAVANPVERVLASGEVVGLAARSVLVARDGAQRQVADSAAPIRDAAQQTRGVVLVFRDVTGERALQEQLRQSQKLQAVGQLAGGIAHDFNNMLGGIMGAADLLGQTVADPEARSLCRVILESAERAAALTQKMLTFARKRPPALATIDLHAPVRAALDLVKTSMDPRVRVEVDLAAPRSRVEGDVSQLQNAFLNLFLNAAQAMPEGGTLRVSSRVVVLEEEDCRASPFEPRPGPHVEVEVRDTGCGIAPENLGRIFEPFFTTKEPGKGTGLGLSTVYGTVRAHQGAVTVYSEPGKGTSFHLDLPLSEAAPASEAAEVAVRGTGRILLVDDEELVRRTAKAQLERLGYEVTTAANGREGLRTFQAAPGTFDLVIVDMAMPEMNGRECFAGLKAARPDVKVVLSSGFTRPEDLERMTAEGLKGFLPKPFRSVELSRVVRDALAG